MKKAIPPKISIIAGLALHLPRLIYEGVIIDALATLGTIVFFLGLAGWYGQYRKKKKTALPDVTQA